MTLPSTFHRSTRQSCLYRYKYTRRKEETRQTVTLPSVMLGKIKTSGKHTSLSSIKIKTVGNRKTLGRGASLLSVILSEHFFPVFVFFYIPSFHLYFYLFLFLYIHYFISILFYILLFYFNFLYCFVFRYLVIQFKLKLQVRETVAKFGLKSSYLYS